MLTIKCNPVAFAPEPVVIWEAPKLMVNGVIYDLSLIPDGATVEHPILQEVERDGDNYVVQLEVGHTEEASHARRFINETPIILSKDGPVSFPL